MLPLLLALALQTADAADTPVLARPVNRGELLAVGDFTMEPRGAAIAHGALAADAAAGMELLRRLPAGAVVRSGDLVEPRLIHRGDPVTVEVVSGMLTISAAGRALGDAGRGDSVRVVVLPTNRTIDASVAAAGRVRVDAP